MAICLVTGKTLMFGNNSSKSNNKTKRVFKANIQKVTLFSKLLGKCRLSLTPKGLKYIECKGGLDEFLTTTKIIYGEKGRKLATRFHKILKSENI